MMVQTWMSPVVVDRVMSLASLSVREATSVATSVPSAKTVMGPFAVSTSVSVMPSVSVIVSPPAVVRWAVTVATVVVSSVPAPASPEEKYRSAAASVRTRGVMPSTTSSAPERRRSPVVERPASGMVMTPAFPAFRAIREIESPPVVVKVAPETSRPPSTFHRMTFAAFTAPTSTGPATAKFPPAAACSMNACAPVAAVARWSREAETFTMTGLPVAEAKLVIEPIPSIARSSRFAAVTVPALRVIAPAALGRRVSGATSL